jgi:hypothetical protein
MNETLYFHLRDVAALERLRAEAITSARARNLRVSPACPPEAMGVYLRLKHLLEAEASFQTICETLKAQGAKFLGCGAYSNVYLVGGVACKVTDTDRGYPHFARLALDEPDNPHYPRIFLHQTLNERKGFHLTLLEPLESISIFHQRDDDRRHVTNLLYGYNKPKPTDSARLRHTVRRLRELAAERNLALDANSNNIMLRPATGELVVTDPFVA